MGIKHLVVAAVTAGALGFGTALGVPYHKPVPPPKPKVIVKQVPAAQNQVLTSQNLAMCAYFKVHKLAPPKGVVCKN